MTGEELQKIKEIYNRMLIEKKQLQDVKNRVEALEEHPLVKEYLKLVGILEEKNETLDKQTYEDISNIVISTDESNKLLFSYGKVGNYADNDLASLTYVNTYRDLETKKFYYGNQFGEIVILPSNHKFIYKNPEEAIQFAKNNEKYENIRKYFFEQLMNESQQDVVDDLVKSDKKITKLK